jgi:hypothetical protein
VELFARRITQKNAERIPVPASATFRVFSGPKKSARRCEKPKKPFSTVLQRQPFAGQSFPTKKRPWHFSDFSRNSRGYPGRGVNDSVSQTRPEFLAEFKPIPSVSKRFKPKKKKTPSSL